MASSPSCPQQGVQLDLQEDSEGTGAERRGFSPQAQTVVFEGLCIGIACDARREHPPGGDCLCWSFTALRDLLRSDHRSKPVGRRPGGLLRRRNCDSYSLVGVSAPAV